VNLAFHCNPALPKLAWLAQVNGRDHTCAVTHGLWVETAAQFFIEGVWDGEFTEGAFDRSACVFGSGAVVHDDTLVFVPSASTTDYLYWWSSADTSAVLVANSLPLLLACRGDELDPAVQDYDAINNSIKAGIDGYAASVPTVHGGVKRLMHWNLLVSPGGVRQRDKPRPPGFESFEDYFTYLDQACAGLAANAKDAHRRRPMAIFSTQSRGYDSTAANAVMAPHGIDLVLTVSQGKGRGFFADEDQHLQVNDDGSDICHFFKLPCVAIERRALETESSKEYLFYACLHETGDFNFLQIDDHVRQPTVLMTGCLGELWYGAAYYAEHSGAVNSHLVRGDLGNHGLTEIRLQAGYVQLAFPYIGARNRADIFRITESQAMAPWRLHNNYDRPIPRRLAEQTGLPRAAFGQLKMASLLEYPAPVTPVNRALRQEYLGFLVKQGLLSPLKVRLLPLVRRWNAIVWTTSPQRHAWNYYFQRLISRLLGRDFSFPLVWTHLNGRIFCFCVNKRVRDYQLALAATRSTLSANAEPSTYSRRNF
jgi:hypothetical protein